MAESDAHGWPSFRDEEVVWDNVRCLRDGESVSVDGTHLGECILAPELPTALSQITTPPPLFASLQKRHAPCGR